MSKNVQKIADLQKEILDLQAEDAAIAAMTPAEQLADDLHELLCVLRHNENYSNCCRWHYDIRKGVHNWSAQSHQPYIRKAYLVRSFCGIKGISTETALELYRMIRGY